MAEITEIEIVVALRNCKFLPGSFDKKFSKNVDVNNISIIQQWWIHKLGYKYRKQIKNERIQSACEKFLEENPNPPLNPKFKNIKAFSTDESN